MGNIYGLRRNKQAPSLRLQTPCDWCGVRGCGLDRREQVKARYVPTMFDQVPYMCPDHEPVWYRGMEGCRG